MKKLIAVVLMCGLLFSMTACQRKADNFPVDSIAGSPPASVSDELPKSNQAENEASSQASVVGMMQEPPSMTAGGCLCFDRKEPLISERSVAIIF